jgi:hypothetical protein
LFAPFSGERGGNVCNCRWHKGGVDIAHAVPDLYEKIKGHPEWRAIILVRSEQKELKDPNNPFDFKCYHERASGNNERGLLLGDEPAELVRLTYMLAGFPSLGVKGYETGYVYYNGKTGTFKECTYNNEPILQSDFEKSVNDAVLKRLKEEYKDKRIYQNDLDRIREDEGRKHSEARKKIDERLLRYGDTKLKLIEIPYSPDEKAKHKELTEKYAFKENRPAEVLILSLREQYTYDEREKTFTEVRRTWQFHNEADSSDFWKVYPNTCRFLCYDLINPEHTLYLRELQRFFLLTLTLAVNQIPGRSLQAYLLYRANLQVDAGELGRVYDKYLESLMTFREIILERMSRVSKLTQSKKKELVPAQYISVNFDQIEESEVKAKSDKIGLATDCPADEARFWYDHIQGTRHTIENILFAPQEIVAEKALETRQTIDGFTGKEQVLDRFQVDRIRKRINELEVKVFNTNLYGLLDTDKFKLEVAKAGDVVYKYIRHRLKKCNILLISLGSFLAFLFGFVPYLINSARLSWQTFGAAFGLVVTANLLLAGGALLILKFLRHKLIKKIQDYNKDITIIFDCVKKSARVFSSYFSDICTYMYARSLLSGVILKKDNYNSAAAIQKAHLVFLENEIEKNKSICSMYKVTLNASSGRGSLTNITEELLEKWPSECQFYELLPCNEKNTMKLTTSPITQRIMNDSTDDSYNEWDHYNTGVTLDAPYSFITGINLVREEIYERKEEK